MKRAILGYPAIAALAIILGLLPLRAWLDLRHEPVVLDQPAKGLASITWSATVASDGRLAVSIVYDYDDDVAHTLSIRLPDGARFLQLNGASLQSDSGKYANATMVDSAMVSYELPGAITRYRDGALLQLGHANDSGLDGDEAMFPCPLCYNSPVQYGNLVVYGALSVPGAGKVALSFVTLDDVRAESDDRSIRFVGIDASAEDVSMVAVLPESAVSGLPRRDGNVQDALAKAKSELSQFGDRIATPQRPSVTANATTAVVLTALLAGLVLVLAVRRGWIRGVARSAAKASDDPLRSDTDRQRSTATAPPNDLEPALVGTVVGGAGPGHRSIVAATLLELARRGVISITGTDSRRFQLAIPAGASGSTRFEEAVLDALRPQGQVTASATFSGPPLWGDDGPQIARRLLSLVGREAVRAQLLQVSTAALLVIPFAIAMGVVQLINTNASSALGWLAVFAGPALAIVVAIATGLGLTAKGRRQRDAWTAYADALRADDEVGAAGPGDVDTLGARLVYAAVLGAAPEVADALSPRWGS